MDILYDKVYTLSLRVFAFRMSAIVLLLNRRNIYYNNGNEQQMSKRFWVNITIKGAHHRDFTRTSTAIVMMAWTKNMYDGNGRNEHGSCIWTPACLQDDAEKLMMITVCNQFTSPLLFCIALHFRNGNRHGYFTGCVYAMIWGFIWNWFGVWVLPVNYNG